MNRPLVSPLIACLAIVSIISFSGCIDEEKEGAPTQDAAAVSVAGSTTVMPLVEACAEEFNKIQNMVRVSVTGGGTDAGLDRLAAGLAEIAMASRKVDAAEMGDLGGHLAEHPIARDAVSIVVSQLIREAGIDELSQDQLRAIYTGEITNWKELGGPDREIIAVSRSPGSGTCEIFNERVTTPGVAVYRESSAEVEKYIAGSDRVIGYLGLNLIQDEDLGVVA